MVNNNNNDDNNNNNNNNERNNFEMLYVCCPPLNLQSLKLVKRNALHGKAYLGLLTSGVTPVFEWSFATQEQAH
eukprot:6486585-Amphidinium_carterae.3